MRSAFDIIGPIMIGPSSSHTAGAVRLGLMARAILAEEVKLADIKLHGSFAQTYKGHGTDRALIAGIMGFKPDDERIRDALQLATKNNIEYNFTKVNLEDAHPNTAIINLTGVSGRTVSLQGASVAHRSAQRQTGRYKRCNGGVGAVQYQYRLYEGFAQGTRRAGIDEY